MGGDPLCVPASCVPRVRRLEAGESPGGWCFGWFSCPPFSVSLLSTVIVSTASPTCSVCCRAAWATPLVVICGPRSCSRCRAGTTHGRPSPHYVRRGNGGVGDTPRREEAAHLPRHHRRCRRPCGGGGAGGGWPSWPAGPVRLGSADALLCRDWPDAGVGPCRSGRVGMSLSSDGGGVHSTEPSRRGPTASGTAWWPCRAAGAHAHYQHTQRHAAVEATTA